MKIKVHTLQAQRWVLGQCATPTEPLSFDTGKLHAAELLNLKDTKGIKITTEAGVPCLFDEDGNLFEVKPAKAEAQKPDATKPDATKPGAGTPAK